MDTDHATRCSQPEIRSQPHNGEEEGMNSGDKFVSFASCNSCFETVEESMSGVVLVGFFYMFFCVGKVGWKI